MVAHTNHLLLEQTLRHQVHIRRLASHEAREILALLETADAELSALLRERLRTLAGRPADFTSRRFRALMAAIREQRSQIMLELRSRVRGDLVELAKIEATWEARSVQRSLPVTLELATPSIPTLRAAVTSQPFSGGAHASRTLAQWFQGIERADRGRLRDAIQLGLAQGETVDQMVRRVAGTRAAGFRDGVLAISRRGAETAVRTAVNHVSNRAREATLEANADIIQALQMVATLDGLTSAVCQRADGKFAPIGDNEIPAGLPRLEPPDARPPFHPNCRTVPIATVLPEGVARRLPPRPFVRDARTRRQREMDFRQEAKGRIGKEQWSRMDERQRRGAIREQRSRWAEENVGTVEQAPSYNEWIKRQPADFQEEVLGSTKAKLLRQGSLDVDHFVDVRGKEITLSQLARQRPEAFRDAGLDPAEFRRAS